MFGVFVALVIASAPAALARVSDVTPPPTPPPTGIHATFVGLAETQGSTLVSFLRDGTELTLPLDASATIRERAIGANWSPIAPTDLRPGSPVVIFTHDNRIIQIDTLYTQVATRFVIVKNGYGVTPSGKIYRLVGRARDAGASLPEGSYVLLRTDPGGEVAYDLIASRRPFAQLENVPKVVVTVEVLVPVNTPPTDVIYMSTDAFSWTPNAIRMSPLPGNRWTVTLSLTGGTILKYKYTRGSWSTDERDQAGNEIANRTLTVPQKGSTQTVTDTVVRWADRSS